MATHSTSLGCVRLTPPVQVFVSQRRTVPSLPQSPPPLTSVLPSGAKHTAQASPSWAASRLATSLPLDVSHALTTPKRTPAAIVLPSGDRATLRISRGVGRV